MKRLHNSYDTALKHLIRLNLADGIPNDVLAQIPKSTIYRWKNEKSNKYLGHEINDIARENFELLKKTAQSNRAKRIIQAYFVLIKTYQWLLNKKSVWKNIFRDSKELLIQSIENVKGELGLS